MKTWPVSLCFGLVTFFICGAARIHAAPSSNYINLNATVVDLKGTVKLSYSCDSTTYHYENVPVNVYIAAISNPSISDTAASIDDITKGGTIHFFGPGMAGINGVSGAPTFSNVTFPETPTRGELLIDTVKKNIFRDTYAFAAVLIYASNGEYVRTDTMPVEVSNEFIPFLYHVPLIEHTIHAGDGYDPYMAGWEVPYPEGIKVSRTFTLPAPVSGPVVLWGESWGTYYTANPVYINGIKIGYIPGALNGNNWQSFSGRIGPSLFHWGDNTITFISAVYITFGHWDDYMVKGWEIFYN